jgi:2-polyprenyl-6-methoxyphenol hydroxylase-like FAD-dependent oxidoreductase
MADIKESPRVIIVGGSIAGLALANMLEQTGVDYIVLEKYQIAPQLGASIALLPNGLRILDQIGCLEALQKEVGGSDAFCQMQTRGPDGKLFMEGSQFGQAVEKRYRSRSMQRK